MTPLEIIAERLATLNIAGEDVDGVFRITTREGQLPAITLSPQTAKVVVRAVLEAIREPSKDQILFAYAQMDVDSPDESYRNMIARLLNEEP